MFFSRIAKMERLFILDRESLVPKIVMQAVHARDVVLMVDHLSKFKVHSLKDHWKSRNGDSRKKVDTMQTP